ncbi:hypothetical protein EON80_09075 [bacterium]|nr:MAG: hypothetical protein EON80_09075 [bacterium]
MGIKDILGRLEAQEKQFHGSLVLAPIISGHEVSTKIAGVTCRLKVEADSQIPRGWSVLEVKSTERANWMRHATRAEREKYLCLLPKVRFIALEQGKHVWAAFPAQTGDNRFRLTGAAVIREVEAGVQPFDTVITRFDGSHFWFDTVDNRRSPAIASYLRESLASGIEPQDLRKSGLSLEERSAYALLLYGPEPEPEIEFPTLSQYGPAPEDVPFDWRHYVPRDTVAPQWRQNETGMRLARSVAHGGAQLVSYIERDGVYSVTYRFGDQTRTSTVRSSDLKVQTSGICLSGRDGDFDLTSLVGVMQEAAHSQPWQFDEYD